MAESSFHQPTTEQLSAFVRGDPIAKNEIAHLVLPQLVRWAWYRFPNLPLDEVESAVGMALAEIIRNHERYDPAQASFTTYAIKLISLRLKSLYQVLKKIKEFHTSPEVSRENLTQSVYNRIESVETDRRIERDKFFSEAMKRLEGVEMEFLRLMLEGESQTEAFAKILARFGPVRNPANEVKNSKARLYRKLQAIADDQGYKADDLIAE